MQTRKRRSRNNNTLYKTDAMVFFDDDLPRNIEAFRHHFPKMKSIHVANNKPYTQILQGKPDFYYPIMFAKKYRDNRYAQLVAQGLDLQHAANLCDQCQNVTSQGMTMTQILKVIEWAKSSSSSSASSYQKKKQRVVLFDLDQTLCVGNMILTLDYQIKTEKNECSVEEIAQYMAGTRPRYLALLTMFFQLREHGIVCKIFTNNGWADKTYEGFPFFLQIMQNFDPDLTSEDIIYGNQNKEHEFRQHPDLMKLYNQLT